MGKGHPINCSCFSGQPSPRQAARRASAPAVLPHRLRTHEIVAMRAPAVCACSGRQAQQWPLSHKQSSEATSGWPVQQQPHLWNISSCSTPGSSSSGACSPASTSSLCRRATADKLLSILNAMQQALGPHQPFLRDSAEHQHSLLKSYTPVPLNRVVRQERTNTLSALVGCC